ncbi:MAG: radical SAM protein [bacterium]
MNWILLDVVIAKEFFHHELSQLLYCQPEIVIFVAFIVLKENDCINILNFIKSQIEELKPTGIGVWWYGGEPLMRFKIINELGTALRKITEKYAIEYAATIITNGFLLNKQLARELIKIGINRIQISVDGPEKVHNKRRILKNGAFTFERIKEAIILAKQFFKELEIRINVDRENIDTIPRLLQEEWIYGENVTIRPGGLRDYNELCNEWKPGEKGFSSEEFYHIYELIREKTKYKKEKSDKYLPNKIPIRSIYCGAQLLNSYIIGPGGLVYKCTACLDSGDEVGIINKGKFNPNEKFIDWIIKTPVDEEPCMSCKLLPMCMGGCPTVRYRSVNPLKLRKRICNYSWELLHSILKKQAQDIKLSWMICIKVVDKYRVYH